MALARMMRAPKPFMGAVALAPLLFALMAPARSSPDGGDRPPDLGECQNLRVQPGNKVAFSALGVGVQIYQWDGAAWKFVAPRADLYADDGANGLIGTHFAGPTWKFNSGGEVVGTVVDQCIADPDSIPWLLLRAASTTGPGVFKDVTYLQRLNTEGGLAPTEPGEFVGDVAEVPYRADYVFYRKGGSPQPVAFATGGDATVASIKTTVDAFRTALGAPDNGNVAGPLQFGRREINWDGGGSTATLQSATPLNQFLNNRGARFTTPGTGFLQAPASGGAGGGLATFFNKNAYGAAFTAFSPSRLFVPIGSNVTETTFFVPGSNGAVRAGVRGFGAVFTDVDLAKMTKIEFFDTDDEPMG
ncbi:MAG TPA: DUF3455 domain-containing protein, partial [Planctomycetia bacterium]|nr:DUF3455 domain-containing protein [Planctomycetia bacterium]